MSTTPEHSNDSATVTDQPPAVDLDNDQWSIDDILEQARLPETVARICMRADLQAEHDTLRAELATMVDVAGNVLDNSEASLGDTNETAAAKAARLSEVEQQMRASTRAFRFRGLSGEAIAAFEQKHRPKNSDASAEQMQTWWDKLAAETCIQPQGLTVEKLKELRSKLGHKAITTIRDKAAEASYQGGVQVPTSPASWRKIGRE